MLINDRSKEIKTRVGPKWAQELSRVRCTRWESVGHALSSLQLTRAPYSFLPFFLFSYVQDFILIPLK